MAYVRWSVSYFASVVFSVRRMGSFAGPLKAIVELSRNLVRLRTGEEGWRICPASLVARVPGKLTLTV